jgi:SprT protein
MNIKTAILNKFNECYDILEEMRGIRIPVIPVKFNLKGCTGGQYRYGKEEYFRINLQLAEQNLDEYLKQVVQHEFSHYAVHSIYGHNCKPHGKEWKTIMLFVFNLEPKTYHDMDTSTVKTRNVTSNYLYNCGCQEFNLTRIRHNKIQKGKIYYCRRCGKQIKFKGRG